MYLSSGEDAEILSTLTSKNHTSSVRFHYFIPALREMMDGTHNVAHEEES